MNAADVALLITATSLIFLMTPGIAFFYGGMVHPKNIISTLLQSFICLGVVSVTWFLVGFSLAFGESLGGVIGNPFTFAFMRNVGEAVDPALSPTIPLILFALFQLKFAIITPAIITGSFAGRVKFKSYVLFTCLFTLFIYAPLAHMTWHPDGFLRQLGVLDFAGGTVVHMSSGIAALVGAIFLGKRLADNSNNHPANIVYVLLGTGMLWFGWFGFNAGSALAANGVAAMAFATTHFASAAAMVTWMLMDVLVGRKPTALGACLGAVVGLVAITPAAGYVSISSSLLIGIVAACICNYAVRLRSRSELDDTLDVFPCHGIGGIVGMLLTGLLALQGGLLITGSWALFSVQAVALVVVCLGTAAISYVLYWLTDKVSSLRVSPQDEALGLDITQHDETILPTGKN